MFCLMFLNCDITRYLLVEAIRVRVWLIVTVKIKKHMLSHGKVIVSSRGLIFL